MAVGAAVAGVGLTTASIWITVGVAAAVVIDIDHLILPAVVGGKKEESLEYLKKPFKAFTSPQEPFNDLHYEGMPFHRMISHFAALSVSYLLLDLGGVSVAVFMGVSSHIAADLYEDVIERRYSTLNYVEKELRQLVSRGR